MGSRSWALEVQLGGSSVADGHGGARAAVRRGMGGSAGSRSRADTRLAAADVQAGSSTCCSGVRWCRAGLLRAGVWALAAGLGVVCRGRLVGGSSGCRYLVRLGQPAASHASLLGAQTGGGERGLDGVPRRGRGRIEGAGRPGWHSPHGNAVRCAGRSAWTSDACAAQCGGYPPPTKAGGQVGLKAHNGTAAAPVASRAGWHRPRRHGEQHAGYNASPPDSPAAAHDGHPPQAAPGGPAGLALPRRPCSPHVRASVHVFQRRAKPSVHDAVETAIIHAQFAQLGLVGVGRALVPSELSVLFAPPAPANPTGGGAGRPNNPRRCFGPSTTPLSSQPWPLAPRAAFVRPKVAPTAGTVLRCTPCKGRSTQGHRRLGQTLPSWQSWKRQSLSCRPSRKGRLSLIRPATGLRTAENPLARAAAAAAARPPGGFRRRRRHQGVNTVLARSTVDFGCGGVFFKGPTPAATARRRAATDPRQAE